MKPFFFFGSLRDPALLEIVVARPVDAADIRAAAAPGFATVAMDGEPYPALVDRPDGRADGLLVNGLTAEDRDRLDYFEEAEYGLAEILVETESGPVEAVHYRATGKRDPDSEPWDYADWYAKHRFAAHAAAVELMGHYGRLPMEQIDDIWPGITVRARMRGRARAAEPVVGKLRSRFGAEDVEQVKIDRPYTAFFAIEEHTLRHRRYDGRMTEPIHRAVLTSGDAVTVLPYDPALDAVMLIEQFRAPAHARGDRLPWGIEVIAGRHDKDGDPEMTARAEAAEEAGLTLGRMERIAGYYPSSGVLAEYIDAFVAEADLSEAGGIFGLPHEAEDIRAFVVPFDDALAAVSSGEIGNGPLMLSLFWLGLNKDRLAKAWQTRP